MIKVAFFGFPILSGNYTHYKYLYDHLADQFQIDLIGLGENKEKYFDYNHKFIHLGEDLDKYTSQKELAKRLLEFIILNKYDIIIPMNSPIVVSVIPFLPKNIKVVQIVNNDNERVYKYVTSYYEYVSQIVCISQRQINKIKDKDNIYITKKLKLIPHGVNIVNSEINYNVENKLKIGYIGRIHQGQKNIFIIPKILEKLKIKYSFEFIGSGPDHELFVAKLKKARVEFLDHGIVPNIEINKHLIEWDVLIFPSFFEGFGLTLIESMNSGVVPLANEIRGITDFIITNEKDGFVIPKNNIKQYVTTIEQLNSDRALLNKMKNNANQTVRERFDLELIIQQYQQLFQAVYETPKVKEALPFSEWKPYVEYKPSFWMRILNKLKIKN